MWTLRTVHLSAGTASRRVHVAHKQDSATSESESAQIYSHLGIPTFFLKTRGILKNTWHVGYARCNVYMYTKPSKQACCYIPQMTLSDRLSDNLSRRALHWVGKSRKSQTNLSHKFTRGDGREKACVGVKIKPPIPALQYVLGAPGFFKPGQTIQPCHACTSTAH